MAFIITLSGCSKKEPEQKPQAGDTQNENKEPESFYPDNPGDRYFNHDYRPKGQFCGDACSGSTTGRAIRGRFAANSAAGPTGATSQPGGARNPVERPAKPGTAGAERPARPATAGGEQGQQQPGQADTRQTTVQAGQQGTADWTREQDSIRKINQQWNSLEPEAIKAGLNPEVRDQFEKTMEELTMNISERKSQGKPHRCHRVISFLFGYGDGTQKQAPAPYYRVKYELMMSAARANALQWDMARQHASSLSQHWEMLRMKNEGQDNEVFYQNRVFAD